jgi:hypothetical protein
MGEYIWGAFVVIVIISLSIVGTATVLKIIDGGKECRVNSDCSANNYCGSDFKCHPFPAIENTIVKNDWTTPAAILGLAVVIAAMVLRKRQPDKRQFY